MCCEYILSNTFTAGLYTLVSASHPVEKHTGDGRRWLRHTEAEKTGKERNGAGEDWDGLKEPGPLHNPQCPHYNIMLHTIYWLAF